MKILLIEDSAGFAIPIKEQLEARGHNVTWIIGGASITDGHARGILSGPKATPFSDEWAEGETDRLVDVDLRGFDAALVDGGLEGPVNKGEVFVQALTTLGVPCIAITGGGTGNPVLIKAGAKAGVPKEFVLWSIRDGSMDLANLKRDPKSVARRLVTKAVSLRKKAALAAKSGRPFDFGYPAFRQPAQTKK